MPCLPDSVHVMTDDTRPHTATSTTEGVWSVRGTRITADRTPAGLRLRAGAGAEGLSRIVLRWRLDTSEDARILGDAWERGYGDLQWRTLQPDRALPWYALVTGGASGVRPPGGACGPGPVRCVPGPSTRAVSPSGRTSAAVVCPCCRASARWTWPRS